MSNCFAVDSRGVYRCLPFDQFAWQEHGFGSRLGNPVANVTLRQIHSGIVMRAETLVDHTAEGDALITDVPGLAIGVRTADCVPMLLLDGQTRAVAAIHAGWRGTASEIASQTVRKLRDDYRVDPANLYAAIGPSIQRCCYQVSAEVAERFGAQFPEWGPPEENGKRMLDLPEANRRQLLQAGLSADRIFDARLCTSCVRDRFFSYRREPANPGRMIAAIARIT